MSLKRFANHDLVRLYRDWLVCQRYSRTTREVYNRVAGKFLQSWGRREFSQVRPMDIQEFMTESSRRDVSGDVVHRYLWALRSFFDFLCLRGVVDDVAPRLVRTRPAKRRLLRALSEANVRKLIDAATNPRGRAMLELFYATGYRFSELVNIRLGHVTPAYHQLVSAHSNFSGTRCRLPVEIDRKMLIEDHCDVARAGLHFCQCPGRN